MATTPSAFFGAGGFAGEAVTAAEKVFGKKAIEFSSLVDGTTDATAQHLAGTNGNDIYVVGAGDTVEASKGIDAVQTDQSFSIGTLKNVYAVQLTGDTDASIGGGSKSEALFGNNGDNLVRSGAGNDVVAGGAGNDALYGDAGNDTIYAGADNDKVDGGAGNDLIDGEAGDDKLFGGSGNDTVKGGAGFDTVEGGLGNDKLFGGADDDKLYGAAGNDELNGDEGDDVLFGGSGNDKLFGGVGKDTLVGDSGSDTLTGGDGNDTFVIDREAGSDTITDFHKGEDLIDLSDTGAMSIDDISVKTVTGKNAYTLVTLSDGTKFKLLGFEGTLTADDFIFG